MKKYLAVILGSSLLCACVYHETDFQAAQQERDAALALKRAQVGCSFIRDHDAYRQCLMNTYYGQQPKNYEVREMTNGQPVAIIGGADSSVAPCYSCSQGCATPSYYQMQAQIAPLPPSGPQIVPYTTSESTTVETLCSKNYVAQEASFSTREVIPAVQPKPLPKPQIQPLPDPTWWQQYQANKQTLVVKKPVCPCPDPNDPCPQCVEK